MDTTESDNVGTNSRKLVIANTVPIDHKVIEVIEDRTNKLLNEFNTITQNLQKRMALVSPWEPVALTFVSQHFNTLNTSIKHTELTADSIALQNATIKDFASEQTECINHTLEIITRCDELEKDFVAMYSVSAQM